MDKKQNYTKREAAEYLGVSQKTLDRWRAKGLPHRQPGGKGTLVLFPVETLMSVKQNLDGASKLLRVVEGSVQSKRKRGPKPRWKL